MLVNRERGIVWLTPPRTASRALEEALREHGFVRIGARHQGHRTCKPVPGHPIVGCVVATVRNHWTAIGSWFGFCLQHDSRPQAPRTFDRWLETFLAGESGAEPYVDHEAGTLFADWTRKASFTVPLEDLEARASALLGAPVHLPIRGQSPIVRPGYEWTPERVAAVVDRFGPEIAALGYEPPRG